MLKATYTINEEDLRKFMVFDEEWESKEKRAPWLLKLFMGKGRPRYSWQVWLSNHWPTKEIPKERRLSTFRTNELAKEIDKAIIEQIMKEIKQEKKS